MKTEDKNNSENMENNFSEDLQYDNVVEENSQEKTEEFQEDTCESEFEPKSRKPKKYLGTAAVAVVAVGMVAAGVYAVFNPANIIKRAVSNTQHQYLNRVSILETVSVPEIINMLDTKSVSMDAEVNINDNSYMPSLNGGGVSFSFDKDVDKKIAQSKVSALYKNTALMDLYAYTDNKDVVIYAPSLFEKAVKFSCNDILKQYYDSPLMEGSDAKYDKEKDFSVNLFDDNKINEKKDKYVSMYSDFKDQIIYYSKYHWSKATENASLERNENKELTIGKDKVDCKSYTLTIPSENVNALIMGIVRDTSNDTAFDSFLSEYALYMYTSQPMYQYFFESESDLEKYLKESVQGAVSNIEKNANFGDMAIKFYINKGLLVKTECSFNVTVDKSVMDINANVALNGENNYVDLLKGEVAFNSEGSVLKFTLDDRAEKNQDSIDISKELNVDDALGNNIKFIANGRYDTKNNQLVASFDKSNSGGDTQGMSLKAKLVPGNGTLNADVSEFNVDMLGVTCSGNALLDVRPLSEEITAPDSEAMEIFKVDKKTVEDAMNSGKNKLDEIVSKVKGYNK